MRVREHHGFGHGLTPGTNHDMNCPSCKAEHAAGKAPVITGADDRHDLARQAEKELAALKAAWAGPRFTRINSESANG